MILQTLTEYYERKSMVGDNLIAPEGWITRAIDYIAVVDETGECLNLETVFTREKSRITGLDGLLPAIGKQSLKHSNSGLDANLLWDNATFVFGRGKKGKVKLQSFIATIDNWLQAYNDVGVLAVKLFCEKLRDEPELSALLLAKFGVVEDFEKRDPVIVFRLSSDHTTYVSDRASVREAYDKARTRFNSKSPRGTCLVTGKADSPIATNETVIKGVWNAQSSGANIVSFNERAFESYGKRERRGENAPISLFASFAYTTALNYLLRTDSRQRLQVGDASVVFWAEKPSEIETTVPDIFGEPPKDDPDRNLRAVENLYRAVERGLLESEEGKAKFFVLGLAPNAARIAIRFWHHSSVAEMAVRIKRHFDDLAIERSPRDPPYLSLFRLLVSIATQGKADNIPPNLAGELMRSILEGLPYPQTLLSAAVRRIRAEHEVSYPRAALIKGCLNRAARYVKPESEEEIRMSLDEGNRNIGYRLGRLFAVLEKIQEEANPGINATIRDRFYGAAASTPVTVFSTLLKLKNHHLSNLENRGRAVNFERRLGEIICGISEFPPQLTLADQGRFAIGYYHQRQDFFKKTENSK